MKSIKAAPVEHTLVIGSAGTGKSTIASALKFAGIRCIDTDYDCDITVWQNKQTKEIFPGDADKADGLHDWIWDIKQLKLVLASAEESLIVCGTANNRVEAYPLFSKIIVLAPGEDTVRQRLKIRRGNDFGKDEGGLAWAIQNYRDIVSEADKFHLDKLDNSGQTPYQSASIICGQSVEPPTINHWLILASQRLTRVGISTPSLDAELILSHVINVDRTWLIAHGDETIVDAELLYMAEKLLRKREQRQPIAYLIGYKEFYGRNFIVTPNVLIPRPESETIIEMVESLAKNINQPLEIIDIGTGSGALGITLKLELADSLLTLTDISQSALKIAQRNAETLKARVEFVYSDLLEVFLAGKSPLSQRPKIIVANLPYVDRQWEVSPELKYEPSAALFANDNGLSLIKQLIEQSSEFLSDGDYLILESDPTQHDAITSLTQKNHFMLKSQIGYIQSFIKLGPKAL